jgi:hypothetical protein
VPKTTTAFNYSGETATGSQIPLMRMVRAWGQSHRSFPNWDINFAGKE